MSLVSVGNFARAKAIGSPFFRVILNNWGNRGTGADPLSLLYGNGYGNVAQAQIIESVYAVAVGPDSTVDRAVVTFNPYFNAITIAPVPQTYLPNQMQLVSAQRPSGPLVGQLTVRASDLNFYTDGYVKDGTVATQPFGGIEPLFESPVLELDFYLRPPSTSIYVPRNPMFRTYNADATTHVAGGEQLIGIFPVFGRKSFAAHFRATGDIVGTARVGAISYSFQNNGVGPNVLVCTETSVGTVNLDATAMHQALVSQSLNAQYLALYYTATAGAGGFVQGHLLADDEGSCCGTFQSGGVV